MSGRARPGARAAPSETAVDLKDRLAELARIGPASAPVVSVYLDTRWADEHQRDRVRIFLKNELAKARRAAHPRAAVADLDWIETQGEALLSQATMSDAAGVALFACGALDLREMLRSRAPFGNTFAVSEAPLLRPLAEVCEITPSTLVVFVDAETARLMTLTTAGAGEEVSLEAELPDRRGGGWAQLAQAQYQQIVQAHRARHYEAVAASVREVVERQGIRRIVLAGEPRNVAAFRKELPAGIAAHVVGIVAGARHETTDVLVARAAEYVPHVEGQREAEEVDRVLTAAAKRGKASAGLEATVEAVNRGAVHRLYLLKGWSTAGRACSGCGALRPGRTGKCPACGSEATPVELGEAMAERVVASGGTVETIAAHQPLAAAGGIAAELRYPL